MYNFNHSYAVSFSKKIDRQSPAYGELLYATEIAQEKFPQSLCVCHKCMCVIIFIRFLMVNLNERRSVQIWIKGYQVCEREGTSFSNAPLLHQSW